MFLDRGFVFTHEAVQFAQLLGAFNRRARAVSCTKLSVSADYQTLRFCRNPRWAIVSFTASGRSSDLYDAFPLGPGTTSDPQPEHGHSLPPYSRVTAVPLILTISIPFFSPNTS
jgi:hypothetical protein